MNTEGNNRAKNKTGFGIPKYFKMKDIWNSDKIKTIRPHELGTGFISKKLKVKFMCRYDVKVNWRVFGLLLFTHINVFANYWEFMKRKIIDMSADLEIDGFQFLLRKQ
nr:hypothetical protein [Mycoplasmopsis bovis]